jgi:hypothetical protein
MNGYESPSRGSFAIFPPNPLAGYSNEDLQARRKEILQYDLEDEDPYLQKGLIIAQDPVAYLEGHELAPNSSSQPSLTDDQIQSLKDETGKIWRQLRNQPIEMWQVIVLCALGAAVQGWDEAAVNGGRHLSLI